MNDQQVKELGKEIRELLPDNTITFKLQATQDMYIKYKDSDNKTTTIRTQLHEP